MAKKKAPKKKSAKPESKSDFLRRVLGRNPDLDFQQINRRWAKAGREGTISNPLYYLVRRELGIKTVWTWGPIGEKFSENPDPAARASGEFYQFKITLNDSNPPIWRRIQVGDCTLDRLHEHIQTSMGWTNSHLNQFRIGEQLYGDPLLMQETFEELGFEDSTATLLGEILPGDGKRFRFEYEYDFGDSWSHEVLFEGRIPPEPGKKYPLCVEGERACPPEDVGGVWGYADFLERIADPEDEERESLLRWAGGKFDPEAFSPVVATRLMKKGLPDWRRMCNRRLRARLSITIPNPRGPRPSAMARAIEAAQTIGRRGGRITFMVAGRCRLGSLDDR